MWRTASAWCLAVLIGGYIIGASADQPAAKCNKAPGMIAGPIVPNAEVAKNIYLAVANGRKDQVGPIDLIMVNDGGDHWSVFQRPADPSSGRALFGGGRLEMTISKCDGSILAHYSR
jgi:hypothetical protein